MTVFPLPWISATTAALVLHRIQAMSRPLKLLLFHSLLRSLRYPSFRRKERRNRCVNTHVQHVVNTIEVEKYITQEKVNQMTKHMPLQKTMELSQLQFTEKVADIPVVVQRHIRMNPNVQETIEIPQGRCTCCVGCAGSTSAGRGGGC